MKKNFAYSLITTTICAIGLACAPTANAATGEKALGFAGGFASYNDGGYGKIYFQYEIAPHVRLAPEMGYIFRNEDCSGFEFSFDVQFPFRLARGFSIYPLAGLTLNNWSYEADGQLVAALTSEPASTSILHLLLNSRCKENTRQ